MVSLREQIDQERYEAYLRERQYGFVRRAGKQLGMTAIEDGAALLQGTFTLGLGMPESAPRSELQPLPIEHKRTMGSHALSLSELRIPHSNIGNALYEQEQKLVAA
jgi:hypothetical protein